MKYKIIDFQLVFTMVQIRSYAILGIIGLATFGSVISQSALCTQAYCDEYKLTTGCPSIENTACDPNNATHTGYLFPSATPCACCNDCLEHIKEGEFCSIGAPGAPLPSSYCGPGLICKQLNNEHPICIPMYESECYAKQVIYDLAVTEGTVGKLMQRPACDGDGNFEPIQCVPGQMCHCVDLNGKRIFGESTNTENIEILMKCECSRMASLFRELMTSKYPQITARCLDDGSYDPLQCIGDKCLCVNRFNGSIEGSPIEYNTINRFDSLACFDRDIHSRSTYLHECESVNFDKVSEALAHEADGYQILNFKPSVCDENGWYNRVQEDSNSKFCVDKYGNQIDDYIVSKLDNSSINMNCHCARARELIPSIGKCCSNGNYPNFLCERDECYCINENGQQTSKEVPEDEKASLICYNNDDPCASDL